MREGIDGSVRRFLERILNLQSGDLRRGWALFLYLFFIMGSYIIARVSRDALFLDQFKAVQLPLADLAIAALVGFAVSAYLAIGRHFPLRNLLVGSLLFFGLNSFVFWWLAHFHDFKWLYPVVYIWVGIFGVLAPAQVWTLANFILTTREAKRIFSLVGSGSILGAILGARFASVMARRYGAESLLLVIAIAITLCSALVVVIWRQKERALEMDPGSAAEAAETPRVLQSLRLLLASPYLRAIAGLILIGSIATSVAGWQFKALAKQFIPQTDLLAAFFGDFYFYAGIAGLLVQLLITSRLLRRFGLGPALFVVPVGLLLGSAGVIVWGAVTIWAAIVLRSGINVLQYSIDKPTVELLYLPVPAHIKNQVKSFIDTVVWRSGDGLAAVGVLAFATTLGWSVVKISWINLLFIAGWFVVATIARRQYVATLRDSIQHHRLDAERASAALLDRSASELVASQLTATDPKRILYALSLMQVEHRLTPHPAVRGLLEHPAPEVRQRAVAILNASGDKAVVAQVDQLLRDPHLEVRTEALLYLAQHAHVDPLVRMQEVGDCADFSVRAATVAYLAHPGPAQSLLTAGVILERMANETGPDGKRDRIEAANLLARLPDQFTAQHRTLLADPDLEVAAAAIRAVGKLRKRSFVFLLLDRISEPELTATVAEALAEFGEAVVGSLRDHLGDSSVAIEIRREIPAILARINSPAAAAALNEVLLEGDTVLRFRTIQALNKIYQCHPQIERDTQMVETVLAAEIMGHYRSYQILGTLGDDIPKDDPMSRALHESMEHEVERIFRLLGLLYPRHDLHSACFGIQSSNRVVHDNALEFLDNVLQPQLRNILVPLLDSSVTIAERVRLANRMVGTEVQSREEAVAALVASEDPWLKSCGAYAVGSLGLKSLEVELDRCLEHPDPLLRETARQAKLRLASSTQPA